MKLVTKIPSIAAGVIVQVAPTWRVTSIIPPRKLTLKNVCGSSTEEDIPTILFTHTVAPNLQDKLTYYNIDMKGSNYHILMGTEMKEGKIKALPWSVGTHVGTSGAICWGRNPYPRDLRQAANMFFDTIFNWEPTIDESTLKKATEKKIRYEGFKEMDITKRILGTHHIVPEGSFDAVLISSEPEHVDLVKDAAIEGAMIPGSDLFEYTPGGFGASRVKNPATAIGLYNQDKAIKYDTDAPDVTDMKMGKVVFAIGKIQPDKTVLFEVGGKKFVYNQENDNLLVA